MFGNKLCERENVCVCVCVGARARMHVCVCVYVGTNSCLVHNTV